MVDQSSSVATVSTTRAAVGIGDAPRADFWDTVRYLLERKWTILLCALLLAAGGAGYAFTVSPWFRSEVVVVPVERKSPLAGLGQIGGLASLAGIDLGTGGTESSMAVLRSREFAADFITSRNLVQVFFADQWDSSRLSWRQSDISTQPDIRMAVDYFDEKVLSIDEDKRAGVVTIGVKWKDPQLAAEWANALAVQINARLRQQALESAERNVRFLQQEIAATTVVALQQSIGRVLESEMQKLMMARGADEYAFKVVDKAVPARKRFRPQRALIVVLSALAGAFLAAGWQLARRAMRLSSELGIGSQ